MVKYSLLLILLILLSIVAVTFFFVGCFSRADCHADINEETALPFAEHLRFHLLAHSDSPFDQYQKDALKEYLLPEHLIPLLAETEDIEDAKDILQEKLTLLKEASNRYFSNTNYSLPVRVELREVLFPTRRYGRQVYSSGEYTALLVIIGNGKGSNWWCVVFPPLCFPFAIPLEEEKKHEEEEKGKEQEEQEEKGEEREEQEDPPRILWKVMEWLHNFFSQLLYFIELENEILYNECVEGNM